MVLGKKIFKFRQCIFALSKCLSLAKGVALHLNKLEFPSPKDALCQLWLKFAKWFWRRFLNFVNVFLLFRNSLPLEKGVALHLRKFPSSKDVFAMFIWNWPRRRWKCEKLTDLRTTGAQHSSLEFQLSWADNSLHNWSSKGSPWFLPVSIRRGKITHLNYAKSARLFCLGLISSHLRIFHSGEGL